MITLLPIPDQSYIDKSIGWAIRASGVPALLCLEIHTESDRSVVCTRPLSHRGDHECVRPESIENSAIVLARWA